MQALRAQIEALERRHVEDRQRIESLVASERVLQEHRRRMQGIIDAIPAFILFKDLENVMQVVNRPLAESIGVTPEEMTGVHTALWYPDEAEDYYRDDLEVIRSGEPKRNITEPMLLEDGSKRWISTDKIPYRDRSGNVTGVIVIAQDVTQLQHGKSSGQLLGRLLEHSLTEIYLFDAKTFRFIEVNRGARDNLGYTRDELRALTPVDLKPELTERSFRRLVRPLLEGRRDSVRFRTIHRRKDGSTYPVEVRLQMSRFDSEPVFMAIILDITRRMGAEQEARRRAETERLLRMELDHRVRNNLASLLTLIGMAGRSAPDARSCAASIGGRVQAIASVHGLLSSNGWQPISLRQLIAALEPEGAVGRLETDGPDVLVEHSLATRIGMVVNELIINSVKYGALGSPDGTVTVQWQTAGSTDDAAALALQWKERGGPPIVSPPRPGDGTSIIEGIVQRDLHGRTQLTYPRDGAFHHLHLHLAA